MSNATRVFGYTDIHWSDRDPKALALAEAAQRAFKPDRVVVGGDLLNAGPFARHPRTKLLQDAEYDLVDGELKPARAFLDCAQKCSTQKRLDFIEGNHDEWIERWIVRTDAGHALKSLMPSKYFAATNRTYIPFTGIIGDRRNSLKLHPNLIVVHGWATPKYAAERHLVLAKPVSIIYHHAHRAEYRAGTLYGGEVVEALCAGCLCKRQPIYAHGGAPSEWVHGVWVAYIGVKSFTMYPIVFSNKYSCVLPDGSEIHL